ncbi:MAG: hypothetical protein BGO31_07015 [Bacteroidetes bacterium 43-16]|nr:MAG: hypothetical protein BGO31_07015 [Bacteroidetes bacterium 43-16]
MKKQFLYLLLFTGITAFMVACAQARDESSSDRESAATEAVATGEVTGKDGLVDITDERRKMMKNADLKMRVTDVQKATISLERATAAMGGLVMQSEISNEIGAIKELPYTTDSLKMARTYQTRSLLKVRVPTMYLDSFLDLAAAQAQFINSRNILVEDASLQYLSNDLKQQVGAGDKSLDKAANLSRKTSEALEVARTEENIAASKIDKQIDNLNIRDKVKYATVSIAIVQPEKVDVCTVADVSKQMEAGWGTQFRNALGSGWSFLKVVLIGLVHIWPLWMIALIVLIVFRNRKKLLARIKAV